MAKILVSSASIGDRRMIDLAIRPNSSLGHRDGLLVAARDDLRQLGQLLHRLALGDSLGTERDVKVHARQPATSASDLLGGARVDGASQDEALAVDQVGQKLDEEAADRVESRVEVLVDWSADDHDDVP